MRHTSTPRPLALATAAALALPLAFATGCGGGGSLGFSFGSSVEPQTLAPIHPSEDGYVKSSWQAPILDSTANAIAVGDDGLRNGIRGVIRFPLGALPNGAHLVSATLRLMQSTHYGNPYGQVAGGQPLHMDHMDFAGGITADAYGDAGLLQADVAALWTGTAPGAMTVDVTASVADDIARGRGHTDFRLRFRFGADGDSTGDYVVINDSSDHMGDGNVPELVLQVAY